MKRVPFRFYRGCDIDTRLIAKDYVNRRAIRFDFSKRKPGKKKRKEKKIRIQGLASARGEPACLPMGLWPARVLRQCLSKLLITWKFSISCPIDDRYVQTTISSYRLERITQRKTLTSVARITKICSILLVWLRWRRARKAGSKVP